MIIKKYYIYKRYKIGSIWMKHLEKVIIKDININKNTIIISYLERNHKEIVKLSDVIKGKILGSYEIYNKIIKTLQKNLTNSINKSILDKLNNIGGH